MTEITIPDLDQATLEAMFQRQRLAAQFHEFVRAEECAIVSDRLIRRIGVDYYRNAPGVGKIEGMAFFEATSDAARAEYFARAVDSMQNLREACRPYLSPIDKMRLLLDEIWPSGAMIAVNEGRKMFFGLPRVFEDSGAFPHEDKLRRDLCGSTAISLLGQIAFNVYLRVSKSGGELEVWDCSLSDEEYDARRLPKPDDYGLDRSKLPPSSLLVDPHVGDLILFRCENVHAVRPAKGGVRLTWSGFIGYQGPDKPLLLWS